MSQETEERKQNRGQTLPSNDVGKTAASAQTMVGPGDCVDRRRRPVGLGHLVPCQSPHNAEGGNGASRPHCSIGCHAKTNCAREEIILPGNVQPFITSPIYARTNDI